MRKTLRNSPAMFHLLVFSSFVLLFSLFSASLLLYLALIPLFLFFYCILVKKKRVGVQNSTLLHPSFIIIFFHSFYPSFPLLCLSIFSFTLLCLTFPSLLPLFTLFLPLSLHFLQFFYTFSFPLLSNLFLSPPPSTPAFLASPSRSLTPLSRQQMFFRQLL